MTIVAETVFVGLDYHAQSVQVCVLDREGKQLANQSCQNDWQVVEAVVSRRCGKQVQVQAAIEACCGSANLADELISQAKWSVDLAHPGYVARMKQSPDKTDYSDARMLADLERWATCRGSGWRRKKFASCDGWFDIGRRGRGSAGPAEPTFRSWQSRPQSRSPAAAGRCAFSRPAARRPA